MATNNTHPGTTNIKGFFDKIIAFFKGNPILSILSSLLMLAIIMPPRSRKYRRKKSGNPGKRTKSRKKRKTGTMKIVGRKRLKKAGLINNPGNPGRKSKKRRSSGAAKPAFMVKGSAAAKAHMAKLRSMRTKK